MENEGLMENGSIVKEMQAQARRIDAALAHWDARADGADDEVRRAYEGERADLGRLRAEAAERLKRLQRGEGPDDGRLTRALHAAHDEIEARMATLDRLLS